MYVVLGQYLGDGQTTFYCITSKRSEAEALISLLAENRINELRRQNKDETYYIAPRDSAIYVAKFYGEKERGVTYIDKIFYQQVEEVDFERVLNGYKMTGEVVMFFDYSSPQPTFSHLP